MSNIPLSTVQERLERSLFEAIRLECVAKGYLPDITQYLTPPQQAAYDNAIKSIATNMGFAVEVFSASSSHDKGLKKVPRIVIIPQDFMPGDIGGDQTRIYRTTECGFNAFVRPPQTVSYNFNVHIISKTAAQYRVIRSMVANALPRRGYINFYDDATENFFIKNFAFYTFDDSEEGIIERIYAYEIPDLYETDDQPVTSIVGQTTIPGITDITAEFSGDGTGDIDDMVVEPPSS